MGRSPRTSRRPPPRPAAAGPEVVPGGEGRLGPRGDAPRAAPGIAWPGATPARPGPPAAAPPLPRAPEQPGRPAARLAAGDGRARPAGPPPDHPAQRGHPARRELRRRRRSRRRAPDLPDPSPGAEPGPAGRGLGDLPGGRNGDRPGLHTGRRTVAVAGGRSDSPPRGPAGARGLLPVVDAAPRRAGGAARRRGDLVARSRRTPTRCARSAGGHLRGAVGGRRRLVVAP